MNETLKPIVQDFTKVINKVGDFAEANPELTTTVIGLGGAFVATTAGLSAFGVVAGLVKTGVLALTALAISPLGVALATGAGLVAAYINNWGGFADFVDDTVRPALDSAAVGFRGIQSAANDVNTIIQGLNNGQWSLGDVIQAAGGAVANEIKNTTHDFSTGASPYQRSLINNGGGAGVLGQVQLLGQSSNQGGITVNVSSSSQNGTQVGRDIAAEIRRRGIR